MFPDTNLRYQEAVDWQMGCFFLLLSALPGFWSSCHGSWSLSVRLILLLSAQYWSSCHFSSEWVILRLVRRSLAATRDQCCRPGFRVGNSCLGRGQAGTVVWVPAVTLPDANLLYLEALDWPRAQMDKRRKQLPSFFRTVQSFDRTVIRS